MPERKRCGRPPLAPGQESVNANVRVPSAQYDRACSRARREDITISELVRRGLTKVLDDDDEER